MKVFENISKLDIDEADKSELIRVINDLIPLRKDRDKTSEYFDEYLNSDKKLKEYEYWQEAVSLNKGRIINPYGDKFILPDKAISIEKANIFRSWLLSVIEDDKYSFGYIYCFLGQDKNRENKAIIYQCVFPENEIEYAIDFDIDKLKEEFDGITDAKHKYEYIDSKLNESNTYIYDGDLKSRFNNICELYLNSIAKKIVLFGSGDTNKEHSKDIRSNEYCWIVGDGEQKQKVLDILHRGIGNSTAKDACKWIRAAIKAGVITKPTYTAISKEFPSIKKHLTIIK